MSVDRRLPAGELIVGRAPARLTIHGLGSCVALFIHDLTAGIGGLAHVLLPGPPGAGGAAVPANAASLEPGRYAGTAVTAMVAESIRLGARAANLRARLAGGARMFACDVGTDRETVGDRNVAAILHALGAAGVAVAAIDVGGHRGRTVTADLAEGTLTIRMLGGITRTI